MSGGLDDKHGLDEAFDRASRRYDLLTRLNPGYHRHLADAATELVGRSGEEGELLDLGCGSGSSTRALLAAGAKRITGVDASSGMLAHAAAKRWPEGVSFVHATAQELPAVLERPVDGVLAAYLFRNLTPDDRDLVLAEVARALRPGGWLVVQEYSVAGRPVAESVWTAVCWLVVIPLSLVVGGSPRLYRYLWRSARRFDSTAAFMERLAAAGFTDVAVRTVPGGQRGILHTFVARRP